ncbi:MAG: hypothetical protein AAB527_02410 [Patescibacteria group bacterium]
MTLKTRRKLFWLSIIAFLIIAPPVVLYTTGWRLTSDFQIKRVGGLFIAVPESGAEVFLNGKFVKNTNFLQSGVFIQNLTPSSYSIMVSKEGFWPWTKKLAVAESAVAEAKALMTPQNINGTILLKGQFESIYSSNQNSLILLEEKRGDAYALTFYLPDNNEFLTPANSASKKLLSANPKLKTIYWRDGGADVFFENKTITLTFDLSKRSLSAKTSSLKLDRALTVLPHKISMDYRQRANIWHDEKNVWVEWLETTLPHYLSSNKENIFQTKNSIRNASFFPKRSDISVVAVENGVFALELDGRSTRNFQPIYKGKEPTFAVLNNEIYVLDQGVLAKMEL